MTFRCRLASILALAACVVRPSAAEACGCGGVVSAVTAFRSADLVFVGTVMRVDDRTEPIAMSRFVSARDGWFTRAFRTGAW